MVGDEVVTEEAGDSLDREYSCALQQVRGAYVHGQDLDLTPCLRSRNCQAVAGE